MCLIAFALQNHPLYRLVLVANRDEYRNRMTESADFWSDAPHVLAGRDCKAGGSWIGVTTSGKFAAITNYRDPRQQVVEPPSRGMLVADYLRDESMTAQDLYIHLAKHGNSYDGFNLLYGSLRELHYFTNRGGSSGIIKPGLHSLSNHLLDTHWPKAVVAKERLEKMMMQSHIEIEDLLQLLHDPATFSDHQLPDTGIGLDLERFLSPLFIQGEVYGTRSTTAILAEHSGKVTFVEKNHDVPDIPLRSFTFNNP